MSILKCPYCDQIVGDTPTPDQLTAHAECVQGLEGVVEAAREVSDESYYVTHGKQYCLECHRLRGDVHKSNCGHGRVQAALDALKKEASSG